MGFFEKLDAAVDRADSLLCIGLDPDHHKLPPGMSQLAFNKAVIDATADLACVFKPNPAFYEALGAEGVQALKDTCDYLHVHYPEIPILIDAKRGDIGNTNQGYTEYIFEYLGADAVTVHPYFGVESLEAFLRYRDRGIVVLCRSSNQGGGEFQDLEVGADKLFVRVAQQVVRAWNEQGNCLLMVGATWPQELAQVRALVGGDMPILVPGVGTQGGDVGSAVKAGLGSRGRGLMINASRGVMFAKDPEAAAKALRDEINQYREEAKA